MDRICSYVLCTSPRSGSTLLCHLLRETGIAGWPGSHFHEPDLTAWLQSYGLDGGAFANRREAAKAALDAGRAHGMGQTQVFGLRLQRPSFAVFLAELERVYPGLPHDRARIEAAFGATLFVHLTREDKLDQAISFVKAQQTGLWHRAPDGTEIERLSEPKALTYDGEAIAAQIAAFEAMEEAWIGWFTREGITPLRITYGDLAANPHAGRDRVLAALGLGPAPRAPNGLPVAKLGDEINRDWADRFRAEAGR